MSAVLGLIALLLIVLAVQLFARALCHLAGEPRWSVSCAAGVAILYAVPSLLGRLTADLRWAAVLTGVLAALGVWALWRRTPVSAPVPITRVRPERWAWIVAGAGLVLVAWCTIRGRFWDETNCHFPITQVLARGVFPPEHPLFPGEPFRYHYGFDVLAALPRAFTGCCVVPAIDIATLASYLLLSALAIAVGAELAGRRGASLGLVLVPFGSGIMQIFLFRDFGAMQLEWSALPASWAQSTPPPVISNFFQHPQGLGMPLALAVLLLWSGADSDRRTRRYRALLGAILLGALSLAQLVFFGVLGLVLGITVLARAARTRRWGDGLLELGMLVSALAIAWFLGGFFEPGAKPTSLLELGQPYFREPLGQMLLHHLVLFGLPLLALPVAFRRLSDEPRELRLALVAAVLIGLAIPNLMTYERSWDIVKFFGIAAFFLNVLLADATARYVRSAVLTTLILVAGTTTAWFWMSRMSVLDGRFGIPAMHFGAPSAISKAVGEQLGPLVEPRDRVLSTNIDLSMGAGFLTPGFDWRLFGDSYMLDRARADVLRTHLERARRDLAREDLDALGVKFLVLSPGDRTALTQRGRRELQDPLRFEHLFDVEVPGDRRHVYRVVDAR